MYLENEQLLEHQYKSEKLHTAVSVALSILFSVRKEMENSALIYSLSVDPKVKKRSQGIDQKKREKRRKKKEKKKILVKPEKVSRIRRN